MTTLTELEKLADTAKVLGTNYSTGVAQPLYESVRVLPQTIKQLIALCRQQHDAIEAANSGLNVPGWCEFETAEDAQKYHQAGDKVHIARTAYKRFDKGVK